MRTDECVTCSARFTQRPNHPAWEFAHCPACYPIVAQTWLVAFVLPAAVGRALRSDDV